MSRSKIVKAGGAEANEFELSVAQEFSNLEASNNKTISQTSMLTLPLQASATELKADLHDLYISAAKELELDGGRKAIIIFVPFRQLKDFHKIQARLVRELEKKFR